MKIPLSNLNHYHFFLSLFLYREDKSGSQIEGLHRRFPTAWLKGSQYPLFNHSTFPQFALKEEFLRRASYCLCEHTVENPELRQALREVLTRLFPLMSRRLKGTTSKEERELVLNGLFIAPLTGSIGELSNQDLQFLTTGLYHLTCLEWEFEEELIEKLIIAWNHCVAQLPYFRINDGNRTASQLSQLPLMGEMRNKHSDLYKIANIYYDQLEEQIEDESLVNYINRILFERPVDAPVSAIMIMGLATNYSLDILHLPGFTKSEVLEVIVHLMFGYFTAQIQDESEIPSVIDIIQDPSHVTNLVELMWDQLFTAMQHYGYAKVMDKNRQFFFKTYTTSDKVSVQALERQVKELQKQNKHLTQSQKQVNHEIQHAKQTTQREIDRQTKALKGTISEQQREMKRLQNELLAAHERLEQVTQQLAVPHSAQDTTDSNWTTDDLIQHLNRPDVMIVGGHPNVVLKLRKVLPKCKYFECEKNYPDDFFQEVSTIVVMKIWVNHGMTARARRFFPKATFIEVDATNVNRLLQQMGEKLLTHPQSSLITAL